MLYRKFPLPPLLGSRLDEKSMPCSGREQLPTLWTGSSSSHLLPAIARILTGAFTQQGRYRPSYTFRCWRFQKHHQLKFCQKNDLC